MDQPRMFRLAVESINFQANYVPGEGWRATFGARRQDEQWGDAYRTTYDRMTTQELIDVILIEVARLFGDL